jgi:hypothetical protein
MWRRRNTANNHFDNHAPSTPRHTEQRNMRPVHSRILITMLVMCTLSLLKDIAMTPRKLRNAPDTGKLSRWQLSSQHYVLDDKLSDRYSSTHQKILGTFSLILTDKDEEEIKVRNGDSISIDKTRVQHRGVVKTTQDKASHRWDKLRRAPRNITFRVGTATGHVVRSDYVEDTRLAVHVTDSILDPAPSIKSRLCAILQTVTITKHLGINLTDRAVPPAVLILSIDCGAVNKVEGQGQLIWAIYGVKLATALAGVDVDFQCRGQGWDDIDEESVGEGGGKIDRALQSILPWFATYQASLAPNRTWPYSGTQPTQDEVCTNLGQVPLDKMAPQIRNDVRKMAVEVVGSRAEFGRRHHLVPQDNTPLVPNVTLDDVIIDFPCDEHSDDGRIESVRHDVGIVHFSEYTKWISYDAESIGIVIEPTNQKGSVEWCRPLSQLLMNYLQKFFPSARVSIYEDDPTSLRFARIAMANQSFSSMSSVGMIPVIGTFGHGYFQASKNSRIQQRIRNIAKYDGFDNIHTMAGKVLSPSEMLNLTWSKT